MEFHENLKHRKQEKATFIFKQIWISHERESFFSRSKKRLQFYSNSKNTLLGISVKRTVHVLSIFTILMKMAWENSKRKGLIIIIVVEANQIRHGYVINHLHNAIIFQALYLVKINKNC